MDVPGNSLAHDLEITQIKRDQEKITNCFQMWAADVCSSLRGKAEPIGFDDVIYVLRYRYSTGNLQLVIMPAKQEIVAEVKVLFSAVAGDYVRESSARESKRRASSMVTDVTTAAVRMRESTRGLTWLMTPMPRKGRSSQRFCWSSGSAGNDPALFAGNDEKRTISEYEW